MRAFDVHILFGAAFMLTVSCATHTTTLLLGTTHSDAIVINQDGSQVPAPPDGQKCALIPVTVTYDTGKEKLDIDATDKKIKAKRCDWIEFKAQNLPAATLKLGVVFFVSTQGDANAHANPNGNPHPTSKKEKHKCKDYPDVIVPTWICESSDTCRMPVYLDMPDCSYHFGLTAKYQPNGFPVEYYRETDPDLEVSGGGDIDDLHNRLCREHPVLCSGPNQ